MMINLTTRFLEWFPCPPSWNLCMIWNELELQKEFLSTKELQLISQRCHIPSTDTCTHHEPNNSLVTEVQLAQTATCGSACIGLVCLFSVVFVCVVLYLLVGMRHRFSKLLPWLCCSMTCFARFASSNSEHDTALYPMTVYSKKKSSVLFKGTDEEGISGKTNMACADETGRGDITDRYVTMEVVRQSLSQRADMTTNAQSGCFTLQEATPKSCNNQVVFRGNQACSKQVEMNSGHSFTDHALSASSSRPHGLTMVTQINYENISPYHHATWAGNTHMVDGKPDRNSDSKFSYKSTVNFL